MYASATFYFSLTMFADHLAFLKVAEGAFVEAPVLDLDEVTCLIDILSDTKIWTLATDQDDYINLSLLKIKELVQHEYDILTTSKTSNDESITAAKSKFNESVNRYKRQEELEKLLF